MLGQKINILVNKAMFENILDKPYNVVELITVASLSGDTQVLLDLQIRLCEKFKAEFEDMFKPRRLSELFGVAFILSQQDLTFMEGRLVSRLVTVLTQSEAAVGGPYSNKSGNIDLAANVFIALFLQSQGVELPNLTDYIWSQLKSMVNFKNNSERSIILYFASQLESADDDLLKQLARDIYQLEPEYGALLDYIRLKTNDIDKPILKVSEPAENLNAITVASILAADDHLKLQNSKLKPRTNDYADTVYKIVNQESQCYTDPLKSRLLTIEVKVRNADKGGEISLLPRYFANAFTDTEAVLQNDSLDLLGAANVFCWAAYTLYDDFIDDEGQTNYLPVANIAMRKSLIFLLDIFKSDEQHSLIKSLFDCMDQANTWELENTRLKVTQDKVFIKEIPDYGDLSVLSNRAAGHIITPLCLSKQYDFTQEQQLYLRQALHHYLVARQLNDDIHDWVEDSKNGHCSYVVSRLLRGAKVMPGEYSHSELKALLKTYFWKKGFSELTKAGCSHIELSKILFKKTKKFNLDAKFFQFLSSIENSFHTAKQQFAQKQQFLSEFKRTN